jgi:hypothetical protein
MDELTERDTEMDCVLVELPQVHDGIVVEMVV